MARKRFRLTVMFILTCRAIVVGVAYYLVRNIPSLRSSFVAIFAGFLAFDIIVAMPRFSLRLKHWMQMIVVLLPRLGATALALTAGLALGALFGGLTKLGLPVVVGAVLTLGLAYSAAENIRGNISSYVGMISALFLFDDIVRLEKLGEQWWYDLGGPILQVVYGTFVGLVMGWLVGIVVGVITRLFLPRGFRSVRSSAYEKPLWLQSFRDVTRFGDDMIVMQVEVGDNAPVAYRTLAELKLANVYGIRVLSIFRTPQEVISPRGEDVILPTDRLTVVLPAEQASTLLSLVKGSELGEQV